MNLPTCSLTRTHKYQHTVISHKRDTIINTSRNSLQQLDVCIDRLYYQ